MLLQDPHFGGQHTLFSLDDRQITHCSCLEATLSSQGAMLEGQESTCGMPVSASKRVENRQITHLICLCLKHLLYDFWGGALGVLPVVFSYKRPKAPRKQVLQQMS